MWLSIFLLPTPSHPLRVVSFAPPPPYLKSIMLRTQLVRPDTESYTHTDIFLLWLFFPYPASALPVLHTLACSRTPFWFLEIAAATTTNPPAASAAPLPPPPSFRLTMRARRGCCCCCGGGGGGDGGGGGWRLLLLELHFLRWLLKCQSSARSGRNPSGPHDRA